MGLDEDGRIALPWLEAPLRQALQHQRAHAVLVQAPEGIGALDFMILLAQGWLCEAAETGHRPCGSCASCRLLRAGSHPDLHLLLPEALRVELGWGAAAEAGEDGATSRRKPSRQIRIDEVRRAIDWVVQSSSRGRAKVVVLHPAEAMNAQSANALLKTLEEPPGQARLLLGAADAEGLLPTVRSRCQLLRLPVPAHDEAAAWLSAQGIGDAEVLLAAAAGRPVQAREMAAQGIDAQAWMGLPAALVSGQAGAAVAGWPLPRLLDALQKLCHDAQCLAAGGAPRYFPVRSLPPGASLQALSSWAKSLQWVARHAEHPWNAALAAESLLSEGRRTWEIGTTGDAMARAPFDTLAR